jgi:hypothetical protein
LVIMLNPQSHVTNTKKVAPERATLGCTILIVLIKSRLQTRI